MKELFILAGLIGIGTSSAFASTAYAFLNSESGTQNTEVYKGNTIPISPYGGSLGANSNYTGNAAAELYCDDFSDSAYWNSGWLVNETNIGAAAAANPSTDPWSNTRFGASNANTAYPVGTTLYEEIAWLFTQGMQAGESTLNQDAIAEAVWLMTDPSGSPEATASNTGSNLTYLEWIADAEDYYNKTAAQTPTQFTTVNYNDWYVLTAPAAAGNTGGTGTQEFLAYITTAPPESSQGTMSPTPEPGTFLLLGAGLLAAGLWGQRKRAI